MSDKEKRTYSDGERTGLMFLAIMDGVRPTAAAHNVPERTLYQWLGDQGGSIAEIREFLEKETQGSYARALRSIHDEVLKRAPRLSDKELMVTFRAMLDQRSDTAQAVTGAISQASAIVVNVTE